MIYKFKTSVVRSRLMRKIKSKGTTPELLFAKVLRRVKIKYTRKNDSMVGKPDFVLRDKKIVIFIDGEFWHGFKWARKKPKIKDNRAYWIPKIEGNISRDRKYSRVLRKNGWFVVRFWEHQIKKDIKKCLQKLQKIIAKN